ncbi:MAG TPA: hypothetical protein VHN14_35895 [Kofleriaceae bacterium]|nr:hypothetical protein [Kofleriaceae bacterium]
MTNDSEPRALGAALSSPAFVTRGQGAAMHVANRHVERWAPEASAGRVRSIRSLGFVDRLVAPWMETAQRSASLRLFSQYAQTGPSEREPGAVSWVFPRPWYQDEIDWMAAARQANAQAASSQMTPTLLTTRGTYVAPSTATSAPQAPSGAPRAGSPVAMPAALYEYVAPSLSLAASQPAPRGDAYSPLISLAAVQAAELMSRTVAPLAIQRSSAATPTAMTPGLRSVLTSILERAAAPRATELAPTRLAMSAPTLVTPPAPRASDLPGAAGEPSAASASATQVADEYAAQRTHIAQVQRIAQISAQRELAARAEVIARTQASDPAAASAATTTTTPAAAATNDAQIAARAAQAAATADVRARAERAEAELRQRATAGRDADAQRQEDAARRAAAEHAREHARIEERIAQRLAERTGAERLHEQARAEAAAHVRTPIAPERRPESSAVAPVQAYRAPAEVTAAIAGLPPELAAILGPAVLQRPERTMQAISELNETLRTVELLARSSAAGVAFEATRGPRLVMPAGLGGLVNAVDRAQAIADRPAVLGGQRPLAPLPAFVAPAVARVSDQPTVQLAPPRPSRDARVPALSWLEAAPRPQAIAPNTALGATATASPVALSHVAWADRWLARFAGATPQSLEMISAVAAAAPATRMQSLANAAPGIVFVAPDFMRGESPRNQGAESAGGLDTQARSSTPLAAPGAASAGGGSSSAGATGVSGAPGPRLINPPVPPGDEPLRRFDDAAETPDDVFAAIAAAASRSRGAGARTSTPAAQPAAPAAQPAQAIDRLTLADLVAHSAPAAPGAGLSAQLASSPFAAALRHVLPLPSAAGFDVRVLFGAGLGVTYLAGLIGPASHALEIGAQRVPAWATWSEAPSSPLGDADQGDRADRIDRLVPGFDATYVNPDALDTVDAQRSQELAARGELAGEAAAAPTSTPSQAATAALGSAERGTSVPLTTLRTALLSWDLTTVSEPGGPGARELVPASFGSVPSGASPSGDAAMRSSSTARMMIDAMSLPMLGELAPEQIAAWAAPGMIGDRAHMWSVAQERSSSDLALDFVAPELVLAARVYGLGPAEAAQAARLAVVGPGQLGAMASAVDRTFVEAMAIGHEARIIEAERRQRVPAAPAAPAAEDGRADGGASASRGAITTAFPTPDGDIAAAIAPATRTPVQPPPSGASFGVDRRTPRGAFLWPSATVAALGLTAAGSDGHLSAPVAALELLAAQVVAEIGTYTALSEAEATTRGVAGEFATGPSGTLGAAEGTGDRGALPGRPGVPAGTPAAALAARRGAGDAAPGAEPGEADVLGAAAALVPASRRARFDALYVALSQSTAGRSWSPAARAARALALAGRGEGSAISARERAATAWDVLPVVYPSDAVDAGSTSESTGYAAAAAAISTYAAPSAFGSRGTADAGASAGRASAPPAQRGGGRGRDLVAPGAPGASDAAVDSTWVHVTASPGLSGLSARAGEALGSYVAPVSPPTAPRERPSDTNSVGAVLRPPTAAPEYVQTGRSGGRYGGGEVEIPPWFEAAARKMLSERSGDADGISLAELTLVTAAPASQIAASTRSAPSAAPAQAGGSADSQAANVPKIDVEKLAHEVYRDIMVLMDVARSRNGDPYQ